MKRSWLRAIHPGRSLRSQLITAITGVHMILMVSFVTDLVDRQRAFLLERARTRGIHHANVLAVSSVPQLVTRDFAGLQDVLHSLAADEAVRSAMVTDETGRIVGHTDPKKIGLHVTDPKTRSIITSTDRTARVISQGTSTLETVSPVIAGGGPLGWAIVVADLSAERLQIRSVRNAGIIYIVVAVVSGAILAVLMANGITRQLRLLLRGAERLAQDRLDLPVRIITANDVGRVGQAFNEAMRKLRAERHELIRARNTLEGEVAERRRAERELKSANQRILVANESLRQFAYAASHDLQEPLRAVAGYADLLKKRYSGRFDADADEFIGYIHSGAVRMQNMIRALLEYSRAVSGDEPAVPVDANRALSAALQNLEIAIESSNAELHASPLPPLLAHEIAVVQLFQNIIGNAIKYAGVERPAITIWADTDADTEFCRFAVRDNGVGISPRDHERIFGIFKRAHGSNTAGTGVGLAICSKIVERYGGRIWVESEPGKGATFYFTLPSAPVPTPAAA